MKKTQKLWVLTQLQRYGKVRRNQALRQYISRLAAIIAVLKSEGMNIEGHTVKTKNGRDYIYELIK